jgi:hypothetical protein
MVHMLYTLGFELVASYLRNDIKLYKKGATIRKLYLFANILKLFTMI